jgi:hypothetical protein
MADKPGCKDPLVKCEVRSEKYLLSPLSQSVSLQEGISSSESESELRDDSEEVIPR